MEWAGRRVTLVGLGARTHVALARFLVERGAAVTISDLKTREQLVAELSLLGDLPVRLSLGGHREAEVLDADIIFVTPGVPRDIPCLRAAKEKGIPLSSETELFFELCPSSIVGITGSSGKTTTTSLVGEILRADGRSTFVGGNIGVPLIERLKDMGTEAWIVLELSSFQLEYLQKSPHVAAILNITPNHLDRHPTMESYVRAKKNIIARQGPRDYAILSADDPVASQLIGECVSKPLLFSRRRQVAEGAFLWGDNIVVRVDSAEQVVCQRGDVRLLGSHNLDNVLAAIAVGAAVGVSPQAAQRAIADFTGVEHRLELVRRLDGVDFYNDSIATAPERVIAALRAFDRPIVLIAGGRSKHLSLEELARLIVERVRALVLMGEMAAELEEAVVVASPGGGPIICRAERLAEAVEKAARLARPGDVVLLSPGGTSFDMFRDFEDRGRQFKKLMHTLPLPAGTGPPPGVRR